MNWFFHPAAECLCIACSERRCSQRTPVRHGMLDSVAYASALHRYQLTLHPHFVCITPCGISPVNQAQHFSESITKPLQLQLSKIGIFHSCKISYIFDWWCWHFKPCLLAGWAGRENTKKRGGINFSERFFKGTNESCCFKNSIDYISIAHIL